MNEQILIASDHAGYKLKNSLINLIGKNILMDLGTDSEDSVDYPDFSIKVVKKILHNPLQMGILICGSGIGMSISANRHKGIRAGICYTPEMAELSRKHNNINILVLPGRFIDAKIAKLCIDNFLKTPFEGKRHKRRIDKIDK